VADQAVIERAPFASRDLGRGWVEAEMVNNVERDDPFAGVGTEGAEAIRRARATRGLRALDEGRAWRRRRDGALVVLRLEAFGGDPSAERAHRSAWSEHGEATLDALWRHRWVERGRTPGWVEAGRRAPEEWPTVATTPADPAAPEGPTLGDVVDWVVVEDHTEAATRGAVACYEHLTIWAGRGHAIVVARHDLGDDLDAVLLRVARRTWAALHVGLAAPASPDR
jgi:hypothetical protein